MSLSVAADYRALYGKIIFKEKERLVWQVYVIGDQTICFTSLLYKKVFLQIFWKNNNGST
jgi:hypothetical protein